MNWEDGVRAMPSLTDKDRLGIDDESYKDDYRGDDGGEAGMLSIVDRMRKEDPSWKLGDATDLEPLEYDDWGVPEDDGDEVEIHQDIASSSVRVPDTFADDPDIKAFVSAMSERSVDAGAVNSMLRWASEYQQQQARDVMAVDLQFQKEGIEELRARWGVELDANLERVRSFLHGGPPGLADAVAATRLPNGLRLGSDPETLQWLLDLSQMEAKRGPGPVQLVDDQRIAELEEYMRTQRTKYMRDEAAQSELRELYARREKRGR